MAQRYVHPTELRHMGDGQCPECGLEPEKHLNDSRFWIPRSCDLTLAGVRDRIAQYQADQAEKQA